MQSLSTSSISNKNNWQTAKTLFGYFWPKGNRAFRFYLLLSVLCMTISKIIVVWMPIFYKGVIDRLDISHDVGIAITIPIGLLLAYGFSRIFSSVFSELRDSIFARLEQRAVHSLAMKVFEHLHELSLRFHLDRKTGKLSRIIERGVMSIDRALRFLIFHIFPTILEVTFVMIVLLYMYEPSFAIIMLVTISIYSFFTIKVTQWRSNFLRQMNAADDSSNTRSIDSLLNYETVKYFVNEKHEYNRFSEAFQKYGEASMRMKQSLAYLNMGQNFIISIGIFMVMLLAAYRIAHNEMTLGDFVLVNAYLIQMYIPLGNLGFSYREIKQSLINLEDMFKLLGEKIDVVDKPGAKILAKGPGTVKFSHVNFSYRPDRQILKDVSFTLQAGKTTAIVGPSGSGKSTIARLLCRFYDTKGGEILIDGQNIAEVKQTSVRKKIGIVPQDTVLFNNTLAYNIGYAKLGASQKQIDHAASMAELDSLIQKLPDRYETLVGERGLKLSGGEKQRVAIARVILKDPEILLFDEATSSLDTTTEKEIQRNIMRVSKGRTTLIIAHRLSTIVKANEIIVLVDGEIKEKGTHDMLLSKKGVYARMWKHQQKEEVLA